MKFWNLLPLTIGSAAPLAIAIGLIGYSLITAQKIKPLALDISQGKATDKLWQIKKGSIYDGDTLSVVRGGEEKKIRFACIDAPEAKQEGGIQSRDYLRSVLNGKQVSLNIVDIDRYSRTVAEVYLGQELVQLKQAKAGMVWAYARYKENCSHWNEVDQAFQQAKREKKGIFSRNAIAPWLWRKNK